MKHRPFGKFFESLIVRCIELIYNFFESDVVARSLNIILSFLGWVFGGLYRFLSSILTSIKLLFRKLKNQLLLSYWGAKVNQLFSGITRNPAFFGPIAIILLMIIFWPDPGTKIVPETVPEIESVVTAKIKPVISEKEPAQPISESLKSLPNFSKFAAGAERKKAFFDYFLPLIENANQSILKSRELISTWNQKRKSLSSNEKQRVQKLASHYRVKDFNISKDEHWDKLLIKVNKIPPSLALAQAANESAWGTSRFAKKGNNFYGQWCFERGCGLVPAKRDANKSHEVAAFKSPKESVERYIHNLNSHNAYRNLRQIRQKLEQDKKPISGHELAAGLDKYSERGQEYIKELRAMITFNKLSAYDKAARKGK